jgi:gliding motility-associated-like protein
VEAVEGTGNPYGFAELSKSNLACVEQTPRLFVPNAFTPNGDFINDFFKPTTLFMDQLPYEMFVFDRWGQQLFYTTNSIDGWDGMFKGQPAVQDNYMYLIRYTDLEGQIIEERGNFQLIR